MGSFNNSPYLASLLKGHRTDVAETLRPYKRNIPVCVKSAKMCVAEQHKCIMMPK
jgi:hypothetical protein